ncbi:hypothetical protein SAMN03159341_10137 [Paenibacillus sp. 1_12]|uniref:hypothetical protein n=1 Tax=Paenibacillus sp. 1_12 TaxID=1566278 RepID=UPI0008E17E72|nr:hypothetical protein [Paenibacillus sp. 1_12]SFK67498.1 hypothetical protein SAMN03159341_10137 [Paenibacillus sp. 1_12]
MSTKWKITAVAMCFTLSLFHFIPMVEAESAEPVAAAAPIGGSAQAVTKPILYTLNDNLKVEVKSILNETTSEGQRIAVVVRAKSTASKVVSIPDMELRVKAADGSEYTLQASVFNAHAIRPQTNEELSYMVMVDRKDQIELKELVWFSVDWYTYPRTETELLAIPVSGRSWNGSLSLIKDPAANKTWDESFQIPNMDSPLIYTPAAINKESTPKGTVYTVKLLVENRSTKKESLPVLSMDGRAAAGVNTTLFNGKNSEQDSVALEPGEKQYLYFLIPTDKDTRLSSLNVLSVESFKQMDTKGRLSQTAFTIGRLQIALPLGGQADHPVQSIAYQYDTPFTFDSLSDTIDPYMSVSMVELHMHENEGEGYNTVVGKFKLSNNGDQPIPLPVFQTKLETESGTAFSGARQTTSTQDIMPGTSYILSYSYRMPIDIKDRSFVLKILDSKGSTGAVTAATATFPVTSTIGAYVVALQPDVLDTEKLSFYPFQVKLNEWSLMARTSAPSATSPITYTYRLKLNLDIAREEKIIADKDFSKMSLELIDPTGKLLSVKTLNFTGVNRLVSGMQFITFDNLRTDEQEYPLSINVYETIATPTGEVKRLMTVLHEREQ